MTDDRQTLLIADDDGGLRETLADVFDPYFDVVTAEDGRGALQFLRSRPADIALFDVQMGDISGLDVIQDVRERRLILPCLLMTARPSDEVLRTAADLGVEPVLRKPFGVRQVVNSVRMLIERAYGIAAVPPSLGLN